MAANGELAREGGGRAEGKEDDVDDEATFFSLELALTGHQSSAFDHHEEEKDNKEDGNEGIDGREVLAAVVEAFHLGDAASEALGTVGPAARLRALARKLRKPKAAGPGRHPSGGRAAAALEEGNRFMASAEMQSPAARRSAAGAGVVTAEERRTPTEAALKYLGKMPILACRSGVSHGPDTSPPPHRPQATAVLPGRKSRGETGLRQLCKRRLGITGSSVAALPPPTPPRRDDSLLQAQDGIASAIAYCKLSSLTPSRGFESPMVPSRG